MSKKKVSYYPLVVGNKARKNRTPDLKEKPWEAYLDEFASEMASVMENAMRKGGDRSPTPWKYRSGFLRRRLFEEFDEWNLDSKGDKESESKELLDIANFCYFLWVRLNKVRQEEVKK